MAHSLVQTNKVPVTRVDRLGLLARWIVYGTAVGLICGSSSALFLWLLDQATRFREGHELIVYALPLAGLVIGAVYERIGQPIRAGTNLVIETLHNDGPEIPLRMAPIALIGTVLTHLFGGSAGREGTAVQMGASLTDWLSHRLGLDPTSRRQLLAAGVAAGFGSVFGTPIAGALFGLEFVVRGRIDYRTVPLALLASIVGDQTTRALGIEHSAFPTVQPLALSPLLLAQWALFAGLIALTTTAFIDWTDRIKQLGHRWLPWPPLRLFVGGLVVVVLWKLVGTSDYLGLGVPVIVAAFTDPNLPVYAFALKLLFTAVTIGSGFVGGEVTPLFFVGAALGSVLAATMGLPIDLGAGVGMAAAFASASNTPLALSVMAVELLGGAAFPHAFIVCVLAWWLTGGRTIYSAQRTEP